MFLLGRWKNYDELEESLCFDELIATINALREKENREQKFMALLQGVEIDDDNAGEINKKEDILTLVGMEAAEVGFGINAGLGYMEIGG